MFRSVLASAVQSATAQLMTPFLSYTPRSSQEENKLVYKDAFIFDRARH